MKLRSLALVPLIGFIPIPHPPIPDPLGFLKKDPDVVVISTQRDKELDCGVLVFKPKTVNGKSGAWRPRNSSRFNFAACKRIGFTTIKVSGGQNNRGPLVIVKLTPYKKSNGGTWKAQSGATGALGDQARWKEIRVQAV